MSKNTTPVEDEEAKAFAQWLQLSGYKFTHIANESGLPPHVAMIAAKKKKAMGVSRGVPDFMVITNKGLVFVEMKRLKGSSTSPEQWEWVNALNELDGVEAAIIKGADKAIEYIESFI